MKTVLRVLLSLIIFGGASDLKAACVVRNSNGQLTDAKDDPLFSILQSTSGCPENVQNLKAAIGQSGLDSRPYMVANRGIHNPTLGSFSFFEQVSGQSPLLTNPVGAGEFFFGHFTTTENNQVIADQAPSKGKLLIELIAWDQLKNLFNFYELIGTGQGAQWFYRGDSKDILNDNSLLYLNPQGPKFGSTLRCSGCHLSGGPIMKEMAAPHNDWWTPSRPLDFGTHSLSPELLTWIQKLGDAEDFSQSVKIGIERLEKSAPYQNAKQRFSLQTTLRPLFCETEINLESDTLPLDQTATTIQIPSGSIVSPLLAQGQIALASSAYRRLLVTADMQFPETHFRDADHGWLVPVKGYSDLNAIQSLERSGIVTEEFIADVLAVDLENPLFSPTRCGLLKLVPPEGLAQFPDRLKASSLPGAGELYENLTNPKRTRDFHVQRARALLAKTQLAFDPLARQLTGQLTGQTQLFKNLIAKREAVFAAELSKNPRGQILEPGFRVIFPVPKLRPLPRE